jgi:hypothetical protein
VGGLVFRDRRAGLEGCGVAGIGPRKNEVGYEGALCRGRQGARRVARPRADEDDVDRPASEAVDETHGDAHPHGSLRGGVGERLERARGRLGVPLFAEGAEA